MPVVVNAQTGAAENLPDDQAASALQAGTHHVPLNDPEGNPVTAPLTDAPGLVQQGYSQPNPDQLKNLVTTTEKGTPVQQGITALEGAGSGLSFGLSTGLERLLGVNPEDIRQREEVNPGMHALGEMGGLGVGMLYGAGEAAGLAKAGEAAVGLAGLGEATGFVGGVGRGLVKGAVESAMMQGGDEMSKLMASDPNQHWETAASNVMLTGLLGAGIGGAFGAVSPAWKALSGSKVGQMIEDFKGRVQEHMANPNPTAAVNEQLGAYYKNITAAHDEVFGAQGLKAKAIADQLPEMGPKISNQTQELSNKISDTLKGLKDAEDPFAARLDKAANTWQAKVTTPGVDSAGVFDATNDFKKQLQEWGKYNKNFVPLAEKDFRDSAKSLGFEVRTALEDEGVWGGAGKVQKNINKAFTDFKPALDDFNKRFTTEVSGERLVDPGKVQTYMNQLGKPSAEIKQSMLKNFKDAADKYAAQIGDIHASLGSESPLVPSPMNAVDATLGKMSAGTKLADSLIKKGLAQTGGKALGAAAGASVGGGFGALIGEHALGPLFESVLPGLAKGLLEKASSATGLKSAVELGLAAEKGERMMQGAAKSVFQLEKPVMPESHVPTEAKLDKLKAHLEGLQKDSSPLLNVGGDVSHYLPDHATAMGTTAARAVSYLNSLKPDVDKGAPLDSNRKVNPAIQGRYNRALTLAQQPLMAMQYMKDGRLNSEDMKTLAAVYPAWLQRAQGQITAQMIQAKAKGQIIPYKTRLGLSVFLGTPLDSTMTPGAMQLMRPPAPPMPPPSAPKSKNQSGLAKIGKSTKMYMTPNQDAESRRMAR